MPPNKFIQFSPSGKVAYATTNNYVAFMEKESVHADFHPLMDFLKNSPISYALTASPTIYAEIVQEMWTKADCSSTGGGIEVTIKGKSYVLTPSVINEALQFPNSNFDNTPTNGEITSMLKDINYDADPEVLSPVYKKNFRKEWSYFFDTLSKGFAGKYSSFDSINIFVLRMAYSLLYGKRIDIGTLLLDEFAYKFDQLQNRDPVIFYARFLMIIANYLCEDLSIEDRNDTLQVRMQSRKLFASLVRNNLNAEVEFVLPEHVQEQVSTLYSSPSPTSSLLLPLTMEAVRESYTSPTQLALPSPYQSGTVATSSTSQSGKRKNTTSHSITEDGTEENETEPDVHPHKKNMDASKVKPASGLLVVDQQMPPAETRDSVPVVELPSYPEEENPARELFLLEPAQEADDRQHLLKAASVLKSRLVDHLTSYADNKLTTEDMIISANKCYNTLEGLGDNYTSFSSEVNKFIAQHQELTSAAKKKEDWSEGDIQARYTHQVQSLFDVRQKLSSSQDKLSTAKNHVDSLELRKSELIGALHELKKEIHEVEERVQNMTAERDQCKEAHSVAKAELAKLDAKKEEALAASKAINDQYNAANKEFERMANHLLQLVRK